MREIIVQNPKVELTYKTYVSIDYIPASSVLSLDVLNNNSFAANDLIVVGEPGEELTEEKMVFVLSGSARLTLPTALTFQHAKSTPVYKTLWDFISIEANYGSGFSAITSSPIQWDSKTNETYYFDTNGTDTTQYKFRFYNSVTLLYSEYSPTQLGIGFTEGMAGYMIENARRAAGDLEKKFISDTELIRSITRAQNIIYAHNARYWFLKVNGFNSSKSILGTVGNNVYSLASITDLGHLSGISYRYTQGASDYKYRLRPKEDVEFEELTRDLNRPNDDHPSMYRRLPPDANSTLGYFEIDNKMLTNSIGIFYIDYYKKMDTVNSVDDVTIVPLPSIIEDFLIADIYAAKGNTEKEDLYRKRFFGPESRKKQYDDLEGIALLDVLDDANRRSVGQPRSISRFRGQKAMARLYGSRRGVSIDYLRENYFSADEGIR